MSVTAEKLQENKPEATMFIVCDDKEQAWFLIEAESVEKAMEKAREQDYDPCYVVEEHLATDVRGIADDGQ